MNIALLGYGKMGRAIDRIAVEKGHTIVVKTSDYTDEKDLKNTDVAIEFSVPGAAFDNVVKCFENQVPVVCGTTGWLNRYPEAVQICENHNGAFIYASNFSLGVNLFFSLNKYLAKITAGVNAYKVGIEEIHHTQKQDKPSGTAITLAEGIVENSDKAGWRLNRGSEDEIPIVSNRVDDIPGIHTVKYIGDVDDIEIRHTAHNRDGFAMGAVIAAEWIQTKKGVFSMQDVLDIE